MPWHRSTFESEFCRIDTHIHGAFDTEFPKESIHSQIDSVFLLITPSFYHNNEQWIHSTDFHAYLTIPFSHSPIPKLQSKPFYQRNESYAGWLPRIVCYSDSIFMVNIWMLWVRWRRRELLMASKKSKRSDACNCICILNFSLVSNKNIPTFAFWIPIIWHKLSSFMKMKYSMRPQIIFDSFKYEHSFELKIYFRKKNSFLSQLNILVILE